MTKQFLSIAILALTTVSFVDQSNASAMTRDNCRETNEVELTERIDALKKSLKDERRVLSLALSRLNVSDFCGHKKGERTIELGALLETHLSGPEVSPAERVLTRSILSILRS